MPFAPAGHSDVSIRIVEDWSPSLLEAVSHFQSSRLGDDVWSGRWSEGASYWHWKFACNPVRPALAALAYQNDTLAGMAAISFKRLSDPEGTLVGEIGDLFVGPQFQRRGIFHNVVTRLVEEAPRLGAALIYSLPNKKAARALEATQSFRVAADATHLTWLKPLRPLAMLQARFGARPSSAQTVAIAPIALQEAVFPQTAGEEIRPLFTPGMAQYRMQQNPDHASYAWLAAGPSDGAWVKMVQYAGLPAIMIGRIQNADRAGYSRCLKAVVRRGKDAGCAFVATWAPSRGSYHARLAGQRFLPVQKKQMMVAISGDQSVAARLRIELLDSDKI